MEKYCIPIPTSEDWGEIDRDNLDLRWAYEHYLGKSCEDLRDRYLHKTAIETVDDLRWMPFRPFVYYSRCLATFLLTNPLNESTEPDMASCFLDVVEERLRDCPEYITANRALIREAVEFIAKNQERFDADLDIYGDFSQQAAAIFALLDRR
ncbi:hypothetical protein [Tahibacter amnicola]|uniref:Uncharacterized protein n=1 Tax=Tahibacter amnicola TaxID=2976241 RepID=A0ABY6BKQ2_9GAMM|nr:hypothetical protein [Tahibacter amnicola]UXI70352.1 hypothetical protein N4264_12175 [Tahibacter amnicola]